MMNNNNDEGNERRYAAMIIHVAHCTLEMIQQAGATLAPEERDQALHILSYALDLDEAWPLVREMILLLAPKMELMGHRYDWMPILVRGMEESQRHGDLYAAAEYELQLSILYRMVSDFASAKQVAQASIDHFDAATCKRGRARGLNELAWIEHLAHEYFPASEHANEAIALLDEADSELGMSYRVLGMIANDRKNFQEAEAYHRRALKIFENVGDRQKTGWCLQNIALALRGLKKYDDSINHYIRAASMLHELQDEVNWSTAQIGLGVTYYEVGKLAPAIDCYRQAESTAFRLHNPLQLAMIQGNLAVTFMADCDYAQAAQYFKKAIELYGKIGDKIWTLQTMEGLASSYIKQDLFHEAMDILVQVEALLPQVIDSPHYDDLQNTILEHMEFLRNHLSTLD